MKAVSCIDPGMPIPDPAAVAQAADLIAQADGIVVAAGAGMGVDCGLPDFRGNAGLWRAYPALAASFTAFMDIASPAAFHAEPRRAWGFYGHRLALYRNTVPHRGYALLRRWGERAQNGALVFTSNVDGHFDKAGFDPLQVDECHGSIHYLQCLTPCSDAVWPASSFVPAVDASRCELLGPLPSCLRCGGPARPNILMFNDSGWIGTRQDRQAVRRHEWLDRVRRPVVIELGAGIAIPTVRHFSHRIAQRPGAALIRINPREPHIGMLPGVAIAGGALDVLSAIDQHMGQARMGHA
ncbi:SIR2 family NAD-dependent protein deacylase [Massilia sp. LXY-6]|uniref:SIR2 family NAD-dependent protein deacylase n=1 Tax=Massilia sp. LXY-6 TaxID=3379823 RepID=UPI003EE211DF